MVFQTELTFGAQRSAPVLPRQARQGRGQVPHCSSFKTQRSARRRPSPQPVRTASTDIDVAVLPLPPAASFDACSSSGSVCVDGGEQLPSQAQRALQTVVEAAILAPTAWYCRNLEQYPLVTKACTSLIGFILGDAIAQHISHPATFDALRAARLGLYGFTVDGPLGGWWYEVLEANVFPEDPLSNRAVLTKTALDQTVYAAVGTVAYFAFIKVLEGHPGAVMSTLQAKFLPTIVANYCVWPLAHLINFKLVPPQFRVLYNNAVAVVWLTYLSMMMYAKHPLFFH